MSLQGRGRATTKPHSTCEHALQAAEGSEVGRGFFLLPFFFSVLFCLFALMSCKAFSLLYSVHVSKPGCPGSTGRGL